MTHADLVARAVRWLTGTRGCGVVLIRANSVTWEVPDAIGFFADGFSILVECKASRADFLRDKKKLHRLHPSLGAGNQRFYLAPPGIISMHSLPANWGLLIAHPTILRHEKDAVFQAEKNTTTELRLLLAHIRRGDFLPTPGPIELEDGCLPDVGL